MTLIKQLFISVILLLSTTMWAQTLPEIPAELQGKVITMIVPFPPGGTTDATQRFLVNQVTKLTGLNIVVVNHGGAAGIIGTRKLLESKPNGLTMMGHSKETHITNPVLEDQAVDPALVTGVAIYAYTPLFLYTSNSSGIHDIKDLVRAAKNDPKFSMGCNSKVQCIAMNHFFDNYKIRPVEIMFKSNTDMVVNTVNNNISVFAASAGGALPFVQEGRLRALGAAWPSRLPVFPDAEPMGMIVPGYRAFEWQMMSVPTGTPSHIIAYYNAVFRAATKTPESIAKFSSLSFVVADLSTDQVAQELKKESELFKKFKALNY